jgi:hypothetical protein
MGTIILQSINCHIKCHLRSICLVCLLMYGLAKFAIVPRLLLLINKGALRGNLSSSYRLVSQCASVPVIEKAIYSASVVDKADKVCFLDLQLIAPPADKNTVPIDDLCLSVFACAVSV